MPGEIYEILTLAAPIDAQTKRIRVLPIGDIYFRGYNVTHHVSNEAAQDIISASLAKWGEQDGAIDYDHQLEYNVGEKKGGTAPASGWMKNLELVKDDGIYADVEWTPIAAQKIQDKEYKYFSPTVLIGKKTGKIVAIKNAGLVNEPSIDGLTKLAAALKNQPQEEDMDLIKIAAALGLAASATAEQVLAKAKELKTAADESAAGISQITAALGVDKDAKVETITASINGMKAAKIAKEDEIIVPLSAFKNLQEQVSTLTAAQTESKVDAAIKAGKITPAQKGDYMELFKTNPETAEKLIASNPKILGDGVGNQNPAPKDGELSEEQIKLCASMGVTKEEFLAARKARSENNFDDGGDE